MDLLLLLQKSKALCAVHSDNNAVSLFWGQGNSGEPYILFGGRVEGNKSMNSSRSPRHLCILMLLILAIKSSFFFRFQEKP